MGARRRGGAKGADEGSLSLSQEDLVGGKQWHDSPYGSRTSLPKVLPMCPNECYLSVQSIQQAIGATPCNTTYEINHPCEKRR